MAPVVTEQRRIIPYEPVGAVREVFLSKDRIIFIDGPAGCGKSRGCLEKIHLCMMRYPGARALLVRQTLASLRKTALVTFEEHVLTPTDPMKGGASRETRMVYKYPNGSEIVLGGLDDVQKILSSEYDLIFIQQAEETAEGDIQSLTTRLRNGKMPYQQMIGDCNPGPPTHWIKEWEKSGRMRLISSALEENPRFYDRKAQKWTPEGAEYVFTLDQLTGFLKDRLRYGKWVAAEGARWPHLDPRIHQFRMHERFPNGIPSSFKIRMGLDYGIRAPYCALWAAVDFDRNLFIFREDYEPGLTADLQGRRIVARTGSNERVEIIRADPAIWAEFPNHQPHKPGDQHIKKSAYEYYAAEIDPDPRFGPIVPGFNRSRTVALNTIDILLGRDNGHPDMFIEQSCVNLWKELLEAIWWDPKNGVPKEDIDPKCPDHAITALYYMAHDDYSAPVIERPPLPTMEDIRAAQLKEINEQSLRAFEARSGSRRTRRI